MAGRDIVVVGGSAGAIEALRQVVAGLPADLPAALFVAVHLAPYGRSYLPEVLDRSGPLPARNPADRERYRPGAIYVAPPDHHLLVGDGFVRVVQGPKENNARPAIDPLFRTAAVSHGPRVSALLLSGLFDDGTAGLLAVKNCGGVTAVQDPADALFPDMPNAAVANVRIDHRLPAAQLAGLLARLAREPLPEEQRGWKVSDELRFEADMAEWDLGALQGHDRPGKPSPFVCPNCQGDLWEIHQDGQFRFRCRTGHAWSPLTLLAGQSEMLDTTLNEAFRALKEKLHLTQRLARRARETGNPAGAEHYEREACNVEQCARTIWEILNRLRTVNPPEGEGRG